MASNLFPYICKKAAGAALGGGMRLGTDFDIAEEFGQGVEDGGAGGL